MFCRVGVLSVGYDICYRSYITVGYGMKVLQNSQNLSGRIWMYKKQYPLPGIFTKAYPTHGHGYRRLAELEELSGKGLMKV